MHPAPLAHVFTANSHRFRLGRLIAGLCAVVTTLHAADWAPNLTIAGIWHDNITNATTSDDQLDSLQLNADLLASQDYTFGTADTLRLSGHAAGDWWPRYQELLGGALGARAEWRHTFGIGVLAPVLSIEGAADTVLVRENGRSGTSSAVIIAVRKRLNAHWRAAVQHEFGTHAARHAVYDRTGSETAAELGYDVSDATRFTLGVRYRNGDVVSYSAAPDAALASVTRVAATVDTFDRPLVASSFDARTWAARAAFLRALDASSAIVIAYEIRQTREQPVRFANQLMSVSLVHQF